MKDDFTGDDNKVPGVAPDTPIASDPSSPSSPSSSSSPWSPSSPSSGSDGAPESLSEAGRTRGGRRGFWRRHRTAVGLTALALVAGGAGAAVATALVHAPGTGSNSTSGGALTASANPVSPGKVAAQVEPAVVDINVNIEYGQGAAAGTGMIITSSGEVLTNNHVVDGATKIHVSIPGHKHRYLAKVIGVDPSQDVALLQIEGVSGLPTVRIGNSASLSVGSQVVAIGNALGLNGTPTVTAGSITAMGRTITARDFMVGSETLHGLLQTDAALAPGDSGGPLVTPSGQVVGMDTAASTSPSSQQYSNVGFAIPINRAMSIVHQIQAGQASSTILLGSHGIMGIEVANPNQVQQNSTVQGAVVLGVVPNSPAQAVGIRRGDVVVAFNGHTITSANTLIPLVTSTKPGQQASVTWITPSGQKETATVTLMAGPAS